MVHDVVHGFDVLVFALACMNLHAVLGQKLVVAEVVWASKLAHFESFFVRRDCGRCLPDINYLETLPVFNQVNFFILIGNVAM